MNLLLLLMLLINGQLIDHPREHFAMTRSFPVGTALRRLLAGLGSDFVFDEIQLRVPPAQTTPDQLSERRQPRIGVVFVRGHEAGGRFAVNVSCWICQNVKVAKVSNNECNKNQRYLLACL